MEDQEEIDLQKGHNSKGDLKKQKNKGEQESKADKIDSIFVARQLIMGDSTNLGKRLFDFKNFKNPNYEKFTDKIYDNLNRRSFSFGGSIDKFIQINLNASQENTTGHQMGCILKGFYKYWSQFPEIGRKDGADAQSIDHLFNHLYKIYSPMSKLFIEFCKKLINKYLPNQLNYYQQKSLQMANKFIKSNSRQEQVKVLPLIYQFNLYGDIPLGKIVDLILRQPQIVDFIYMFKTSDGKVRQNLVKIYIDRTVNASQKDINKCQKLIRDLNLDPFQFDNYITKLEERYIGYIVRQYKLFYIELLIHLSPKLIFLLIQELQRKRRDREAYYFMSKYGFEQDFNCHFSKKQKEEFGKIRNVLLDCDAFGPTEIVVLEQDNYEDNFIYLGHFGIKEKDVIFIDGKNIDQFNLKQQLNTKIVSIDSQRAGGTHPFDPAQTQIFQLYTGRKVFIFDYRDLKQHKMFIQLIQFMFSTCKIYGQDHLKELTSLQRQLNLNIQEKVMQDLMRSRAVDSAKFFKQVFPKESKSSLLYMCDVVFHKKLSKYQQCSGWRNRPLRKAQLHYAALDALLPREICRQLLKQQKQKKQKP